MLARRARDGRGGPAVLVAHGQVPRRPLPCLRPEIGDRPGITTIQARLRSRRASGKRVPSAERAARNTYARSALGTLGRARRRVGWSCPRRLGSKQLR